MPAPAAAIAGAVGEKLASELVDVIVDKIKEAYREAEERQRLLQRATAQYANLSRDELERIALKAKEVAERTGVSFEEAFTKAAAETSANAERALHGWDNFLKQREEASKTDAERVLDGIRKSVDEEVTRAKERVKELERQLQTGEDPLHPNRSRVDVRVDASRALPAARQEVENVYTRGQAQIEAGEREVQAERDRVAAREREERQRAEAIAKEAAGRRIVAEAEREGLNARQLTWRDYYDKLKLIRGDDKEAHLALVRSRNRKLLELDREQRDKNRALADAQAQQEAEEHAAVDLWLQDHEKKREAMRNEAAVALSSFQAAGGRVGVASQLEGLASETKAKLDHIKRWELEGVIATEDAERLRTAIAKDQSERRLDIIRGEASATKQIQQMGINGFRSLAQTAVGEFGKILTSSRAYEKAMKAATGATVQGADLSAAAFAKMAQDMLASIAEQAAVQALFETAKGLSASVTPGMQGNAAGFFASAAMFAAAAAAAGTAAYVIGQNRGMTASERASVGEPSVPGGSSGTESIGGGTAAGGSGSTREYVILLGNVEYWETPAEAARRLQRGLEYVKTLDLARRSEA